MVAYGAHISGVECSSHSPASLRESLTSESQNRKASQRCLLFREPQSYCVDGGQQQVSKLDNIDKPLFCHKLTCQSVMRFTFWCERNCRNQFGTIVQWLRRWVFIPEIGVQFSVVPISGLVSFKETKVFSTSSCPKQIGRAHV